MEKHKFVDQRENLTEMEKYRLVGGQRENWIEMEKYKLVGDQTDGDSSASGRGDGSPGELFSFTETSDWLE